MARRTDRPKKRAEPPARPYLAYDHDDDLAEVVLEVTRSSCREMDSLALAHEEAFVNSLAAGPDDTAVHAASPYGGALVAEAYRKRRISRIVSSFTAEQVNALATRLSGPYIGQREVIYVDPRGGGPDAVRAAAVREQLWELAIRGPLTSWSQLVWQLNRDVAVYSRAFGEVVPVRRQKYRTEYTYGALSTVKRLIRQGIGSMLSLQQAGMIRSGKQHVRTVWDGPVIRPLPFGSVHKEQDQPIISDLTRLVVVERDLTFDEIVALGAQMFPTGSKVPFDETAARTAAGKGYGTSNSSARYGQTAAKAAAATMARPSTGPSECFSPFTVLEIRGEDPNYDSAYEWVGWVLNGTTIGQRMWDGSGSAINTFELAWDPMTGYTTSASVAMLHRRRQEMLSLLEGCTLNAALWECLLSGGVNTDVVTNASQVKNLRPGDFFDMAGQGQAIQPIQLGRNSAGLRDLIRQYEDSGRVTSGVVSAAVGIAPQGAGTLGEYAGITQGGLGRIDIQQEINADTSTRRMFTLTIDAWRDGIPSDAALMGLLGQDPRFAGARMRDLDFQLEAIPMAARYNAINQAELQALERMLDRAQRDPVFAARLKPEIYDDYAYAVSRARGYRYVKTSAEVQADGRDPNALQDAQIAKAASVTGKGEPSPPSPVPATGADLVQGQAA